MDAQTPALLTVKERFKRETKAWRESEHTQFVDHGSMESADVRPRNGNGHHKNVQNGNGNLHVLNGSESTEQTLENGNGAATNGHAVRNGHPAITPTRLRTIVAAREYKGKRTLDLSIGSVAFLAFLLLTPVIALGIKLNSKGPVFYRQKRTGKKGEVFECLKFRTMKSGSSKPTGPEGTPDITTRGDDRIFLFGRLLRLLNLDELPQIINVMKGEMSLVGPRPYPIEECAWWNSTFEDFYLRYGVRPGITGVAQVKGYRGGTLDEELMRRRTDFDLIYVQKNSLSLDLKTILMTVGQMVNLKTNAH
ncbi:MAG: sugar transferase [Bacteroidota bacterium]